MLEKSVDHNGDNVINGQHPDFIYSQMDASRDGYNAELQLKICQVPNNADPVVEATKIYLKNKDRMERLWVIANGHQQAKAFMDANPGEFSRYCHGDPLPLEGHIITVNRFIGINTPESTDVIFISPSSSLDRNLQAIPKGGPLEKQTVSCILLPGFLFPRPEWSASYRQFQSTLSTTMEKQNLSLVVYHATL